LHGIYLIAYGLVTLNAFLYYTLLKRIGDPKAFAFTGALAFCLFPADLTRAWLTSGLGLQPPLTYLLVALHCYLSGRRKLSYAVILASLLSYETTFLPFLAAPLLEVRRDSRLSRRFAKHAVVLGLLLCAVVLMRKASGESRIGNLDLLAAIRLSMHNVLEGPITSMATFFYRPLQALATLNLESTVFLAVSVAVLSWFLFRQTPDTSPDELRLTARFEARIVRLDLPGYLASVTRPAMTGFIMLVLAYPLALTATASATATRELGTRSHLAAAVGGCMLFGSVCSAVFFAASAYGRVRPVVLGLAGYYGLLVVFGLSVQRDSVANWQYVRAFWSDVVRLCPDMTDGTRILVADSILRRPRRRPSWTLSINQLNNIYRFPDSWEVEPNVYQLRKNWRIQMAGEGNLLRINEAVMYVDYLPERGEKVESSNVILLEERDGELTRRTEPLRIAGREFPLKQPSSSGPADFEKGHMYSYLIRSHDEEPASYLQPAGISPQLPR